MPRLNAKNCNYYHFKTEEMVGDKLITRRFFTVNDIREEYGISTFILYNLMKDPEYQPKRNELQNLKIMKDRSPVYVRTRVEE